LVYLSSINEETEIIFDFFDYSSRKNADIMELHQLNKGNVYDLYKKQNSQYANAIIKLILRIGS